MNGWERGGIKINSQGIYLPMPVGDCAGSKEKVINSYRKPSGE
jgi:hypothetical protein